MTKRILTILGALFLVLASQFSFQGGQKAHATDEINEYINAYVSDGLVSLFSGKYNTKEGHDASSTIWENLVGTNVISLTTNENNKFTDDSFQLKATKQYFTNQELTTINGSEFTLEFLMSDFTSLGFDFNTLINSGNDSFALFRRVSNDTLEFKFAGVGSSFRPMVNNAKALLSSCLVSLTYKVNGSVRIYLNGALKAEKSCSSFIGANDLYFGHSDTSKSFEANFKSFRFYDKELSSEQILSNAVIDGIYEADATPAFNALNLGETNIIGGINSIRRINTSAELTDVMMLTHLPQAIIYKLDENLNLILEDSAIVTLDEAIAATQGKIMPVFDIHSEEIALKLVEYLNNKQYYDCFVSSGDATLVKLVRSRIPNVSGVIDYQETFKNKASLSKEDMIWIRADMHQNFGTVAILPIRLCSHHNVQYLYDSIVNVWSALDSSSHSEIYQGIVSGAIGVISNETETLFSIAAGGFKPSSMTRLPLNIGHRGLPVSAPENTIEGARLAYESGADVIELDIYLTKDNEIAIMHDPTTGRTCDEDLHVESATLAELKQLYVNKGFEDNDTYNKCRIPTLEEYLAEFQAKDIRLFIEVKSGKENIIPLCKNLINEYGMHDQVSFISFSGNQLANLNKYYPEATTGYLLSGVLGESSSQEDMLNVMRTVGQYNATLNPNYAGYGKNAIIASLSRGISVYPWTFKRNIEYVSYLTYGYSGLTGDDCSKLASFAKKIEISNLEKEYYIGQTVSLNVAAIQYDRSSIKATSNVSIKLIDANAGAQVSGSQITFTEKTVVDFVVSYEFMINPTTTYTLYSDVISINVGEKTSSNVMVIGTVALASVSAVGLFFLSRNIRSSKEKSFKGK